jgi:chaperonin GroES
MTQATVKSIRPLGDRIVVRPQEREEMTKSGIVLPDTAKEKPQQGTVIAVGQGKLDDDGDRVPMEVQEGQTVLFAKYAGTEFTLEGEDVLILRESDILGILS